MYFSAGLVYALPTGKIIEKNSDVCIIEETPISSKESSRDRTGHKRRSA